MRRFPLNATPRPWIVVAVVLLVAVFVKNAWVCDDAYIIFRSLDQLAAGHGPTWNPHERVQVFTSPLWFGCLALLGTFSSDHFLNSLALSAAALTGTLILAGRRLGAGSALLLLLLLLLGSNAFFDFTTSGLENPLAYLLLAAFWVVWSRGEATSGGTVLLGLIVGWLLCVRLDLAPLVAPALTVTIWRDRGRLNARRRWVLLGAVVAPLLAWTIISVIYYGFPLPNPVYAKLNTGLTRLAMAKQGVKYLLASLRYDSLTLPLIAMATLTAWTRIDRRNRALALGLALQLIYVVMVGGDFMQGRFLAAAYLLAALMTAERWRDAGPFRGRAMVCAALGLYVLLAPHTPVNSPFEYRTADMTVADLPFGVADERGEYGSVLSLTRRLATHQPDVFPDHVWAREGRRFAAAAEPVAVAANVGMFGYCAGIGKIIVDPLALTDPLLARLPVNTDWRSGHFPRRLPDGYLPLLRGEVTSLSDPALEAYRRDLWCVVSGGNLWSRQRWAAIARLNFGAGPPGIPEAVGGRPARLP